MPIAVAPIDRQADAGCIEFGAESGDERTILGIDGADAAKMLVVFDDFQHSFPRHVFTAQHVFQKRQHIIGTFRPAKRHYQDRIKGRTVGHERLLFE